jgi:glycine hydroxymethyltransferase
LRLGSPAVTTRGMKEDEMLIIADFIHEVLKDVSNTEAVAKVKQDVLELCKKFPLPY